MTDFFRKGERLGKNTYNFDSKNCMAEPLWNVTAKAGLKTLVWHWPGSSWPPTSEGENLYVVDGTQPEGINCGNAVVDSEKLLVASAQTADLLYRVKAANGWKNAPMDAKECTILHAGGLFKRPCLLL